MTHARPRPLSRIRVVPDYIVDRSTPVLRMGPWAVVLYLGLGLVIGVAVGALVAS